jgi:hypothetical protein
MHELSVMTLEVWQVFSSQQIMRMVWQKTKLAVKSTNLTMIGQVTQ